MALISTYFRCVFILNLISLPVEVWAIDVANCELKGTTNVSLNMTEVPVGGDFPAYISYTAPNNSQPSLLDCSSAFTGASWDFSQDGFFNDDNGANPIGLDIGHPFVGDGSQKAYKIKVTPPGYDGEAYLSYVVTDDRQGESALNPSPFEISQIGVYNSDIKRNGFKIRHTGSFLDLNWTQGINISKVKLYLTKVPKTALTFSNINIGSLQFYGFGRYPVIVLAIEKISAAFPISLNLTVQPPKTPTCIVDSQVVTLPRTSIAEIDDDASKKKAFTITAKCRLAEDGRSLKATLTDINNISNTTNILKNTGTSNISVRIYDKDTGQALMVDGKTPFDFGTLESIGNYAKTSKSFYAGYAKKDSEQAKVGTVDTQATISITYK